MGSAVPRLCNNNDRRIGYRWLSTDVTFDECRGWRFLRWRRLVISPVVVANLLELLEFVRPARLTNIELSFLEVMAAFATVAVRTHFHNLARLTVERIDVPCLWSAPVRIVIAVVLLVLGFDRCNDGDEPPPIVVANGVGAGCRVSTRRNCESDLMVGVPRPQVILSLLLQVAPSCDLRSSLISGDQHHRRE